MLEAFASVATPVVIGGMAFGMARTMRQRPEAWLASVKARSGVGGALWRFAMLGNVPRVFRSDESALRKLLSRRSDYYELVGITMVVVASIVIITLVK